LSYRAGETVVIRDVHARTVFFAWPLHVLEDGAAGLLTVQVPGAVGKVVKGYPTDRSLLLAEITSGSPTLVDLAWSSVLRVGVITPGTWWCTWLMWDATSGDFLCYYVDFLRPVVRRGHLLDTLDLGLDVVVAPDGTWRWKDLDDVALLQERGWLGQEDLAHLERAKVEVVGAVEGRCFPFDGSLIARRPDPSLSPATLPVDWDQLPRG
jgi:predicted RNA-binding protein associated with RNAse of E/G family